MPGPPPEHPHLRLLKGNPGKRPARSPPEPARNEQCPAPRAIVVALENALSFQMTAAATPSAVQAVSTNCEVSLRRPSCKLAAWLSDSAQARTGPFLAIDAKIKQSPDQGRGIKRPDLRCRRHRKAHDQGDRAVDAMRGLALVRRPIAGSVHPDGSVRDTHR